MTTDPSTVARPRPTRKIAVTPWSSGIAARAIRLRAA
jgi:hypothetical protein